MADFDNMGVGELVEHAMDAINDEGGEGSILLIHRHGEWIVTTESVGEPPHFGYGSAPRLSDALRKAMTDVGW